MHGLGSDERDLAGLVPELDRRLLVVSLRAPRECDYGGFAWFDVQWTEYGARADETQALESRELVLRTLAALPGQLGIEPSQTFVGGFSQGAMMSLGVALAIPERLAGVILMSGRLLPAFLPAEPAAAVGRLPFLIQHGTLDPILPVEGSREIRARLQELGCPIEYREYPMAHEISRESLDDTRAWLSARIG